VRAGLPLFAHAREAVVTDSPALAHCEGCAMGADGGMSRPLTPPIIKKVTIRP